MNFTFYVHGSSVEPYKIECNSELGVMSCTCQAGMKKQICKHRIELLKGNIENLHSGLEDSLNIFLERIQGSQLFNDFMMYENLDRESELLEQKLKAAKSQLLKTMRG